MTTGKTIALTRQTFVGKVISLLFNMLSRLVIAFLPRSKHLSISWLQSQSAVILEPKNKKSLTVSTVSPFICHEVMGQDAMILVFEYWVLSQFFHSPLSLLWRLFSCSSLSAIRVVSSAYLWSLIFLSAILIPAIASSSLAFCMMYSAYAYHLPAMQETWVWFLGQEDPLEKQMATHSSILAWRIPWIKDPDRLQSTGSQKSYRT